MTRRTPMHRQIADQLRRRIAEGYYETNALPPELTLMEEFDVSRHTVRSALQRLVDDRVIERRAGSGTRITDQAKGGIWGIGSLNQLIGEFSPGDFLTVSAEHLPARQFPDVAAMFEVPKRGTLFRVLRIMTANDKPYAVSHIFTSSAYARLVPPGDIGSKQLIYLVEAHARVRPVRARQVATAMAADEQTAQQIGVAVGSPVLSMRRTFFDVEGRIIMHVRLFCRPDRYEQTLDFVHEPAAREAGDPAAKRARQRDFRAQEGRPSGEDQGLA